MADGLKRNRINTYQLQKKKWWLCSVETWTTPSSHDPVTEVNISSDESGQHHVPPDVTNHKEHSFISTKNACLSLVMRKLLGDPDYETQWQCTVQYASAGHMWLLSTWNVTSLNWDVLYLHWISKLLYGKNNINR